MDWSLFGVVGYYMTGVLVSWRLGWLGHDAIAVVLFWPLVITLLLQQELADLYFKIIRKDEDSVQKGDAAGDDAGGR